MNKSEKEESEMLSQTIQLTPFAPVIPQGFDIDLHTQKLRNEVLILMHQKKFAKIRKLLNKALKDDRFDKAEILYLQGKAHYINGRLQDALVFFEHATNNDLEHFDSWVGMGEVYSDIRDYYNAIQCFWKAKEIKPDFSPIWRAMGEAYLLNKQIQEAVVIFAHALKLDKNNFLNWYQAAAAVHAQGRMDLAMEASENAVNDTLKMKARGKLEASVLSSHLFMMLADPSPKYQNKIWEYYASWEKYYATTGVPKPKLQEGYPGRKIRIGYVGADFYAHAALNIYLPLFKHADKERFEIFAYNSSNFQDHITAELRGNFDHFRMVKHLGDRELFELITKDKIDILIDLNGHTVNNRLMVFAQRPAPIQITGLGFVFPLNLSFIDYCLADEYSLPDYEAKHIHEKALYVPSVMHWIAPDDANKDDWEVAEEYPFHETGVFTFGSANNLYKLNSQLLGAWATIVKRTPQSRLFLKCKQFDCPKTEEMVMKKLLSLG